ncbi:DUF1365 domain-containing protein [Celeribacter arenosi]|uniref:DUF1365 domain-containing protein n=1 Tax=Celeribacter arenosi TaxID=792649 RepID=A0ABP7JRW8_9RHOB
MTHWPQHIAGHTVHGRRGGPRNSFRYGVDCVLIDPDATEGPRLFSRNGFNLASVHDRDHGGPLTQGIGATWARAAFAQAGLGDLRLELLTQPRFLGYAFNPVSFWFGWRGADLIAVIAEVSTPFGDRHSYLCFNPDHAPIRKDHRITARKHLHVSPFQDVAGLYHFNFDIDAQKIAIRIFHENGAKGVIATLHGKRARLTNRAILLATLRRPFGPMRTIALIHWQALKLKLKGARWRRQPTPPTHELTLPEASSHDF